MRRIKILMLLCISLLFFSVTINAQVGLQRVAQTTMNFQLVSVSPRASALGEALVSIGNGAESIFFNPAGIVQSEYRFDAKFYLTRWIADIDYMAGVAAWNLGSFGTVGFHALSVDYGTIYGTSLLGKGEDVLYPAGYKDNGLVKNVGAYSIGLSYGRAISTQFAIGGTVRLAGQSLGQNTFDSKVINNDAVRVVYDAGVNYKTGLRSFQFGMAIRNFSSNVKRERIYEQLPLLFTMGVAIDVFELVTGQSQNNQLNFAIDFLHPNNYSERINMGLEYSLMKKFVLRCGYQTNRDVASWSAGFGINSTIGGKDVIFDYSYSNFDIFDGVNRLSVGFNF